MAAPQPAAATDPREHIAILWRRKWWILACVVVAVAAALAYSLTRTELYRSTTQVAISGTPSLTGTVTQPQSVAAEVNLADSAVVRSVAREQVGAGPTLSVSGDNTTASLTFTAVSDDATVAAEAADAYAAAFIAERQSQSLAEYEAASAVLQGQLNDVDAQIAEVNQREAEALVGVLDPLARVAIEADFQEERQPLEDARGRYRTLLDNLSINLGLAQSGGVRVTDPATVPSSPFSPDIVRNVLLAAILGLVAGVGLAYLLQYLDTRLRTDQELEDVSGLPTLTVVPLYGSRKHRKKGAATLDEAGVVSLVQPRSDVAEAYRRLRTSVQFLSIDRPLKTLQVTSPGQGDGKTTTATNLAVTAARAGQRVVLMDCDLRRPRLHECFSLANDTGVTTVLTGQSSLTEAVRRLPDLPGLVILPTGPVPPDPAELLGSGRMSELIDRLAESADLVIIDTPPVLAVSDPLIMAARSDALLMVASASRTDRRQLARALAQLRQVDAPLIGTVLNRFEPGRVSGYGGYGYGYGYGHYQSDAPVRNGARPDMAGDPFGPGVTTAGTAASADPDQDPPASRRSRLMRR
ncbi:polysaccharide biosynthesis tyrosine autokinase [Rhabdothermincola salaria]|uniref:polysaccharide biosynthesis tyrosine autokinase n=1 Tax=Rhabdothermincola salaria TaxID=2903142 RepID=UPI001E312A2D|nr:polysaccharide biosynthesis tyrosine autokinase [Rhabdothermincola salaria]MCD9622751.1 polysaccharide biosynthesis tyrosine autokinase [Rhabdothermincola salaria]